MTLLSPTAAMTVGRAGAFGTLTAGGSLVLDTQGGALTLNRTVTAGGNLSLLASGVLAFAGDADGAVEATTAGGDIVVTAGSLSMGSSGSRIAAGGRIDIVTSGSATIGQIASTLAAPGNATVPVISITAGSAGSISGNGDGRTDLVTSPTGGILLAAGAGIDLAVSAAWLDAAAGTGNLVIRTGGALRSSSLASAGGAVHVTAAGNLTLASVASGAATTLSSTGGSLKLGTLTAGSDAALDADDDIEADAVAAAGAVVMSAGGSIAVTGTEAASVGLTARQDILATILTAAGDATLDGGGKVDVATLDIGGSLLSTAVMTTRFGLAKAGTSMTVSSGGLVEIGTASTGSDMALTSTGGSLKLGTLTVGTDASLHADDDIEADGVTAAGAVVMMAGGAIALTDTQAGSASLTAWRDVLASTLTTTGDAMLISIDGSVGFTALTAGRDTVLEARQDILGITLTVAGDARFDAGGKIDVGMLDIGRSLTSTALTTTRFGLAEAGTSMAVLSGGSVEISTASTGSDMALTSTGGSLKLGALTAGGAATLDADDDIEANGVEATGAVVMSAGGSIALTDIQAGSTRLTAQQDIFATTLTTTGDARLISTGGSIGFTALIAGGDAALEAQQDIVGTTLTTTGDTTLDAGRKVDVGTLDIGGALASTAVTTTQFRLAEAGTSMTVSSGGLVEITAASTGSGMALTSTGGSLKLGTVTAGGDAALDADDNIEADAVTAAGAVVMTAGGSIAVTDTQAGSASLTARRGILATTLKTAGDARLISTGGSIGFAALTAGGDAALEAQQDIAGTTLTTTGDATLHAGGKVDVRSLDIGGALASTAVTSTRFGLAGAGTSMTVSSGGLVEIGSASAGGVAAVSSSAGSLVVGSLAAGSTLALDAAVEVAANTLRSGGAMRVRAPVVTIAEARAGGELSLDAADRIDAALLVAERLHLANGSAGSVRLGRAEAVHLAIVGGSLFEASELALRDGATMAADTIRLANVTHTGTAGPLALDVTGRGGADASRFDAFFSTATALAFGDYRVADSSIGTNGTFVSIARGFVTGALTLRTALRSIFVNNRAATPVQGFDVQLFQPSFAFKLTQDGMSTTSDAFIVNFGEGSEVFFESGGLVFAGMSMVREFEKLLQGAGEGAADVRAFFTGSDMARPTARFLAGFLAAQTRLALVVNGGEEDEPAVNLDSTVTNSSQQ